MKRISSGARARIQYIPRVWLVWIAVITMAAVCWPQNVRAEIQWTNSLLPGPWPTSAAACLQGEVEPRIAALRTANPSQQYRYRSVVANEFLPDEESQCNYLIERRVSIVWVTQETGPRTHFQLGSNDPCPEGTVDNSGYCLPKNAGPPNCPNNGSNPIDSGTANKYQRELDYSGAGTYPLIFSRHYNSLSRETGALGNNWRHDYERSIAVTALSGDNPTQVKAYRADGKRYDFNLVSGVWRPDADVAFKLERLLTSGNPSGWRLTTADDDVETYDARGLLASIALRSGQRHTLAYNSAGRLASVTDSEGRMLSLTYDGSNRISTVINPANQSITFTYDGSNRLQAVTYPDASSRSYLYNESALTGGANLLRALTGIVDESGVRFASFGYDTQTRAVSSQHAGGAGLVTVSYGTGGVRTVTDSLSAARTFSYSTVLGARRNTGISQTCNTCGGAAQNLAYDANGNVSARTDFNGNTSVHSYDLARNLETSRTEAAGSAAERTITTAWHATFRLPSQIDEPGRRTAFTHDANGNVLTRTVTDLTVSPSTSRTWTYTYDSLGRVLTENGPRLDVSDVLTYTYYNCTTGSQCGQVSTITNSLGHTTTYNTYNAHGQPLTITDTNGLVTTLAYDLRQRLVSSAAGTEVTSFTYYPTGLMRRATLPDGSFIDYTYDAAQRLTRLQDAEGNHVVYAVDAMGNTTLEEVFDPANVLERRRSWAYNALNFRTKEIGGSGASAVTTTFGYDANGNETNISAPLSRNTANTYDALNRIVRVTDPADGVVDYEYNALDQMLSITDPRSKVTTYTYNAWNDRTGQVSPDSGTTTSTYDSAGNLSTRTDARNRAGTYSYDALNRTTQILYADQTIAYTYDTGANQKGRVTQVSDLSGTTNWTYDRHGRALSRQQIMGAVSKAVAYTYDAAGRMQSLTLPSGNIVNYGYDINGKIEAVTLNGSTTILSNALYAAMGATRGWTWGNATFAVREYDIDGNLTDLDSAGLKTYSYDDAFRIVAIADAGNTALSRNYGYDLLDRLTGANGGGSTQSWSYDASGNRLTQGGSQPSTYAISASSNRLAAITGSLTRSYSYDAAGNVTSDGTTQFVYNDAGRLVSATRGSVTAAYAVNALGQRVRKTVGSASTYFVYDEAGHLIGEYDNAGNLIQETVWYYDIPVAVLKPSGSGVGVFYIHTDHLDTPRRVSRPADNAVVWSWNADPFGVGAANEDPDGDAQLFMYALRFPGQYHDAETGLHYNYFRDYDPAAGRYAQSDPIGLDGGINTYVYAEDAPILFFDPDGLRCTARQLIVFQLAVNVACKWSGQLSCSPADDCKTNQTKIGRISACITARKLINQKCFNGGDAGHKQAVEEYKKALQNCLKVRPKCCAGGNCD